MFVACGIWCLADVSSVSPSSEQTHTLHKFPQVTAFANIYLMSKTKELTYLNMGLINKVDMVCLSPVGYGV